MSDEETHHEQNEISHAWRYPAKGILLQVGLLAQQPDSGFCQCRFLFSSAGPEPYYTNTQFCRICATAVCISLDHSII